MEEKGKRRCDYQGRTYSHGSEVCGMAQCRRCNDGKWQVPDEARKSGSQPSLAYFYH